MAPRQKCLPQTTKPVRVKTSAIIPGLSPLPSFRHHTARPQHLALPRDDLGYSLQGHLAHKKPPTPPSPASNQPSWVSVNPRLVWQVHEESSLDKDLVLPQTPHPVCVYVVAWTEFRIVLSNPHICSAMVGVPYVPSYTHCPQHSTTRWSSVHEESSLDKDLVLPKTPHPTGVPRS